MAMSSAVVCQGLQPYVDSQLFGTRIPKLKLASPEPHLSESIELSREPSCKLDGTNATKELRSEKCHYQETNKKCTPSVGDIDISSIPDLGGWSFLQALSKTSQTSKESSYVPPLMKRSPSMLSEKSLELCTENLGSETGTDNITESSIFPFFSLALESRKSPAREQTKSQQFRKVNSHNFPPPLTTIRGMNSLQIRPHRKGGRLIIRAADAPLPHTCLQAERSHGRLRLCFLKDSNNTNFDSEVAIEESEGDDENDYEFENETSEEEEVEEQEEDDEESDVCASKDMDGNSFEVGVPTRCKEGGHGKEGLCSWDRELFWVATS